MKQTDNVTPSRSRKAKTPNPSKKKKRIIAILAVLILALIAVAATNPKQTAIFVFDQFFSDSIKETLDKSYEPIEKDDNPVKDPAAESNDESTQKPISVLLIGSDQRDKEPARSDALIYSIIRPEDNKILLISIPRDSYAYLVGRDTHTRINAAYAYGGAKMSVDTVEYLLEQPVHYYASINFKGLIDVVDTLGGVELPIEEDIVNKQADHEKFTIEANQPIYNGVDALNYTRYREDSDFKRTERQRIFIKAVFDRMLKLGNLNKLDDLVQIGGENMATNMKSDLIIDIAKSAVLQSPEFSSYMLKGKGEISSNGAYYYKLNKEDLESVKEMIGKWLTPDATDEDLMVPTGENE